MPEVKTPLRQVQVNYICDACHLDIVQPTGEVTETDPVQYLHQCRYCKRLHQLAESYPIIRLELAPT